MKRLIVFTLETTQEEENKPILIVDHLINTMIDTLKDLDISEEKFELLCNEGV